MSDPDAGDTLSVDVAPQGADYLGEFTYGDIDPVTGEIEWSFSVDDAVLDRLGPDDALIQEYEVTVTDALGAKTTETVTVTINGSNDRPEPEDDVSLIPAGGAAVLDVRNNDADVDEGQSLTVTEVDGQPILPGGSVTLTDGSGSVSMSLDGALRFVPADGVTGAVVVSYKVDDGSGASNATAGAQWVINIASVDITDDASPADAGAPDDVLSSVDDLENVVIGGKAPAGGSVTSLTVSDGVNSVTVPADGITVRPDGTYEATADLSGLSDGTLTVTAQIEDAGDRSVTTTDTILKDTQTTVAIDPVLIEAGSAPTVTGAGEPGATITLDVNGDSYEVEVDEDGAWSVTLDGPLSGAADITADAVDKYGNTAEADRSVTGVEITDEAPGAEHVLVQESGLPGGSNPGTGQAASSTFVLSSAAALSAVVIGGAVSGGAISGGTKISLAELQTASATPVVVTDATGTLTITGYDAATGVISYTYTLTDTLDSHSDATRNDTIVRKIQVAVIENDGDIRVEQLGVGIVDDAPAAPMGDESVTVTEGGAAVGSASGGANLLANDVLGADGGRVHQITYDNRAGDSTTATVPEGSSVTVETQYGTLTVGSDGSWSYTPLPSLDHDEGDGTVLRDDFTYSTIDGDGDISDSSATQPIVVGDTVPGLGTPENRSIDEASLATGSNPNPGALEVSGSLDLTAGHDSLDVKLTTDSAPAGLEAGGAPLRYVLSADGHTLTADTGAGTDPVFIVRLTDPTSTDAGYTFELLRPLDHGVAAIDLTFGVEVTDADGDKDTAEFTVTVADDVPESTVRLEMDEDGDGVSYNISADATAQNTVVLQDGQTLTGVPQPDGSVQYQTEHGFVTISASGVFDFVPAANFSGDEVFVVRTTDDDAGIVDMSVTVAVTPVADAPTVSTDDRTIGTVEDTAVALGLNRPIITDAGTGDGNNPQSEALGLITLSGLPAGTTLLWGSESLVVDASGTVSISLSDYAGAQLPGDPDISITVAEFEALQVLPPANASANFEVTYSVTSYEVDGGGAPIGAGATSSAKVMVYVQADTDPATLVFDTTVDAAAVDNADAIVFDGSTLADVTLKEDTTFDLSQLLSASFADLDNSEIRSITITNNADSVIMVAGEPLAVGASVTIPAGLLSGSTDGLPQISIGGPRDFSGDLEGITVTLNAQDKDADGYLDGAVVVPGVADGLPEADRTDNSVTLNLYVTPVADDVVAEDAQGEEDSQIAFLAGVGLSDTSAGTGGTEVITAISFEVPDGWQVTASAVENAAASGVVIDHTGSTYTISFSTGTEAEREAYLDGFTILPPAHDSRDAAIELQISTRDSAVVNGDAVENEKTATHTIDVMVTPVAEKTTGDTDDNGSPDVGMTPGFLYETPAEEDTWFALNSDGFSPAAGWSNEDAGEETYARLEPMQVLLDGTTTPAIGSQFRWTEGGEQKVAVFNGTTIDVPVSALGTLEFRAAENFSGQFTIRVQAYTVDTDADGDTTSTAVSGEAFLTNVLITPSADEVTLSLVARTQGDEDTAIPLTIQPTSSDPSETFNVTISGVPDGAVLTYNGVELVLTGASVTIEDFDSSAPLSILPPPDSNETIDLTVSSVSVDRMEVRDPKGGTKVYTDVSDPITLGISIDVRGVADEAEVTATPQTYVEGNLDGGAGVLLSELVSVDRTDIDGSETLTVQVTGLPEGFGLNHGTLLTGPGIAGEDRIWALSEAQLETAGLTVPANFSGSVAFSVIPVTTEDDGASRTGTAHPVSFTVTPTPEATVTTGVTLVEDALQPLTLGIVPQNGDADEILEAVLIRVSDVEAGDFSLFLGAAGSEVPLAEAGLMIVQQGGVDYYQLTGEQVAQLSAQGAPHLDGALGGFDLLYKITDPGDGTVDPVTSDWTPGRFELSASPATDQPELSIGSITTDGGSVNETAVTVAEGGEQVTVNLNVASSDSDGSEAVIRVIIEGVPAGVAVEGAELAGDGLWLLIYEGGSGPTLNDAGGLTLPVVFTVSEWAGGIEDAPIRITVQTQDRGNEDQPGTEVLSDTIEWSLTTTFEPGSAGLAPAIDVWDYTDARATEDASFTLSEMIEAQVTAQDNIPAILTIALSGLPDQTVVSGMVSTIVNGAQVWTASVITEAGDTPADVQAKLDALMDSIEISPAADANDNNLDAPFSFDAVLTSTSLAGGRPNAASVEPEIPVTPVTDPAAISIVLGAADADGLLTEGDSEIPLSVTVSNPADGASGMIEGGVLYLQIGGSNGSGVLTLDGEPVAAQTVSGVEGIPDGAYYVIDGVTLGSPLDLVFTPDAMVAGELTVDAWVRNIETGATAITSTGNVTLPVAITNDGASLQNPGPISGIEASASNRGSLIELDLGLAANDADGSEVITKVLLSNLPEGFLIYAGTSQADATMATNAGGVGGLNTWVLLGEGGSLPPYIALLPPKHWSGTLDDLTLIVTSGETALSQERVDELQIGPVTVTPVADGIELTPTNSFGREGDIVPLNLNASMTDFKDASVDGAPDGSVESVTLALRGLGEHASFYIGTTIVTSGISYDAGTDTYTLTGLSQSDVDGLGVRQAASALTDTDAGEAGVQIEVTAHTRDGSDVSDTAQSTVTLNLNAQLPTTGDDRGAKGLIWTGSAIDGLAGEDTVQFRYGESLTGAELAQRLKNIETLDLGIEGRNAITDLTPDQVLAMTDSDNRQTITGSTEDEVSLSGDWTDLGNGSYSGIGAGGVEVVLTVENVTVNMPVSGFSAMMMSFAAPEEQSFGLASIEQEQPSGEAQAPSASDPVSYEELLMSDPESEDLLAGLPEEKAEPAGGGDAASEPDPSDATSGALLAQTLEDELNAAALHEV
ncbi:hypothetical protein FAZ78_02340 [Cereibacter changlensis]|uniref:RapA2 cadherin-like domain-containing protein n=1 Tax=Cereibacter changlensis TaxID=402884 RepID=A0A4U0YZ01_9RHOB|nr:Ig-like domain-containing protein [Cereibacter changlensis]TKA98150.1 hypothetical protein FAZ78_02340 [Cereibacter changlensis]